MARQETRTELVTVERNGRAHQVRREVPVPTPPKAPKAPRDWDSIALRCVLAVTAVLTLATIAWSTVSIGHLLGGGWEAYGAALIFDAAWLVVVALEWLGRYEPRRRKAAQRVGYLLLALSMLVIGAHGWTTGDEIRGVAGAAVALGAKVVWAAVLGHLHRELTPETAAWVAAEADEAHAQLATARVHRMAERSRAEAAAHRLAMEHRYGVAGPVADDVADDVAVAELVADEGDVVGQAVADQLHARQVAAEHGYGPQWHEASARADASMQAALDAGHTARTVLEEVSAYRSVPRPEAPETPERTTSAPVRRPEPAPALRPETPGAPEPKPTVPERPERVPDQRPPTLRQGVHTLVALGMTDPQKVHQRLSQVMDSPPSPASVERYVREARQHQTAQPAHLIGTEGYH